MAQYKNTPAIDRQSSDLSDRIAEFSYELESIGRTDDPIPAPVYYRSIAVVVELNQQYIDLLDEVKEELELTQGEADESSFGKFSRRFDAMYSRLTPEQAEYFTRKGVKV